MYKSQETLLGTGGPAEQTTLRLISAKQAPIRPIPRTGASNCEAVKRWFYNDWRRIEPKLRTSIVEGISVFLSLFDDNPVVKRTFCPPRSATTRRPTPTSDSASPCLLFRWLIENGKVCSLNFPAA